MTPTAKRKRHPNGQITGKLLVADPIQPIRWLARSQPDPRWAPADEFEPRHACRQRTGGRG